MWYAGGMLVRLALVSLCALPLGCKEAPSAAAQTSAGVAVATPPKTAVAPSVAASAGAVDDAKAREAAQSSYQEKAFELELIGPGSAKVGEVVHFEVHLEAASGFKVNDEYPLKFKFESAPGVSPKQELVPRDRAKVEKTKATLPLEVTFTEAGKRAVTGRLSFSVCTEESCLIEKRDLRFEVDAS